MEAIICIEIFFIHAVLGQNMVNKSEMPAFYILKNNSQLHVIYNNIQSSSFQSQIVQS